jgi:hypothetical protein
VTKKPLILVTGATGFFGREAVAQWVDAVKAGKMFVQPTVKQLLGRPGHSFDDYLRANAATLNT